MVTADPVANGRPATPVEREMAAEAEAELQQEIREGRWDAPSEFDDPGPAGFGWAPNPYPGGSIV